MKVKLLNSGWQDSEFEEKLQKLIDETEREGYYYYDIKITSSGLGSMVIFKEQKETHKVG